MDLKKICMGSRNSGYGPVASSCEHGNELSGSIKGGEIVDWINNYQLLKKDSASSN
jgi:hypothetical protein